MFCSKCGNQLAENVKFCAVCGTPVQSAAAPEEPVQTGETIFESPVQEEAPAIETPVQQEETPVMSGTPAEPENVNEVTQEAPQPVQQNVYDGEETVFAGQGEYNYQPEEQPQPAKKKSKKGLVIGASVAAVAVGAGAVGYFGFSNEIMRLFMGEAKFAQMVEKKSVTYVNASGNVDSETMAEAIESGFGATSGEDMGTFFTTYGDSEMRMSMELELGDLLDGVITGEQLEKLLNSESVMRVVQGDGFETITYALEENGSETFDANIYIKDEKLYLHAPDFTQQVFLIEQEEIEEEEAEGQKNADFDPVEAARIAADISNIYFGAYEEAEITFEKGEFDLNGEEDVKCEKVEVFFDEELTADIWNEIIDYLKNDEYLKNYYILVNDAEEEDYEALFEDYEAEEETSVTIINYIGAHAKLMGKEYIWEDEYDETTSYIEFAQDEVSADIVFGTEDVWSARIDVDKSEDGSSGLMTAEIYTDLTDEELPPILLEIEVSGFGTSTYNEIPVNTGKYTFRVSEKDEFFDYMLADAGDILGDFDSGLGDYASADSLALLSASADGQEQEEEASTAEIIKNSYIEWSTECDGTTLKSGFDINLDTIARIALNASITPYSGEAPVMPDVSGAISTEAELSEAEDAALQREVLTNISAMSKNSGVMSVIAELLAIDETLAELDKYAKYGEHFAAYSDDIRYNADYTALTIQEKAEEIYSEGISNATNNAVAANYNDSQFQDFILNYYYAEDCLKAKVYFDENGSIEVLDDGGMYFADFTELSELSGDEYRNIYVEILAGQNVTYSFDGNLGTDVYVTIVYTDDPADLPENLPEWYNFCDDAYEWGDSEEENIKNNFIMATYPVLNEGVSEIKSELDAALAESEELDKYAKQIYTAVSGFFDNKDMGFYNSETGYTSVEIVKENGQWAVEAVYDNGTQDYYNELFDEDLTDSSGLFLSMLNANQSLKSIEGIKAEIHVVYDYETENFATVGVTVISDESDVDFEWSEGIPEGFDYASGFFIDWNGYNDYYPCVSGVCYDGNVTGVGTYSKLTDSPIGGYITLYELFFELADSGEPN